MMHTCGQPSERLTSRERKRITGHFPRIGQKSFSCVKSAAKPADCNARDVPRHGGLGPRKCGGFRLSEAVPRDLIRAGQKGCDRPWPTSARGRASPGAPGVNARVPRARRGADEILDTVVMPGARVRRVASEWRMLPEGRKFPKSHAGECRLMRRRLGRARVELKQRNAGGTGQTFRGNGPLVISM